MILEHVAPVGSQIAVVLPCHFHGFDLFRADVGVVSQADDGRVYFQGSDGEYDQWEIRAAFSPDTDLGRALAAQASSTASNFDIDKAVRVIYREAYEDGVGNSDAIVKGCWCDTPNLIGFKDRPGIYLIRPGSNSAYGTHRGGFPSEAAAKSYAVKHGLVGWRSIDTTDPQHDDVLEDDGGVASWMR